MRRLVFLKMHSILELKAVFSEDELTAMKKKGIISDMFEFVEQINKAIEDESFNGEYIISQRLK